MDSVVFVNEPSNTVWIRDYGPNNIYSNNVEDLYFVDWVYNRPRPDDDAVPAALSEL
jgi:agmatine deiminase